MSLSEWDRNVAPRLHQLEDHSSYIARHARGLRAASEALISRPAWLTKAEAQMARAESDLMAALTMLRNARTRYAALPETVS
jgi:hypothetical protein